MDINKTDMYIMTFAKYFPTENLPMLRDRLMHVDDTRLALLSSSDLKDPDTMIIISIFLGSFGIDRFIIGDIGMGLLKLLTVGVCGIFTIVDLFLIQKRTREKNFEKVLQLL